MPDASARRGLPQTLFYTLLFVLLAPSVRSEDAQPPGDASLRWADPSAPDYRTPRAGEGFRTRIFGRDVEVQPRDRRSTSAWDVGMATWYRWPEDQRLLPFGSLYFWRRPSERWFFRGTVVGLYNDLTYAHSLVDESPFEVVLGFESETIPTDSAKWVDGERIKQQELLKGNIRGGVGLGYRRQVEPGFGGLRFLDEVRPAGAGQPVRDQRDDRARVPLLPRGQGRRQRLPRPGRHLRAARAPAAPLGCPRAQPARSRAPRLRRRSGRDAGLARALERLGHRPAGARGRRAPAAPAPGLRRRRGRHPGLSARSTG